MKRLFINASSSINIEFFRYFIVGGLAFVIDFSTLYLLTTLFEMNYLVANIFAFCAGLVLNYILSITWVFSNRKMACRKKEFYIFALVGVAGLFINELSLWFFVEYFDAPLMYSKLMATAIVFFWNFTARKIFLF